MKLCLLKGPQSSKTVPPTIQACPRLNHNTSWKAPSPDPATLGIRAPGWGRGGEHTVCQEGGGFVSFIRQLVSGGQIWWVNPWRVSRLVALLRARQACSLGDPVETRYKKVATGVMSYPQIFRKPEMHERTSHEKLVEPSGSVLVSLDTN